MTDYNDGQWHGWNGGECPIDPGCMVEFQTIGGVDGGATEEPWIACELVWSHDGDDSDIIAFRVIKARREPRAIWLVEWSDGCGGDYSATCFSKGDASQVADGVMDHGRKSITITRFVEDDK